MVPSFHSGVQLAVKRTSCDDPESHNYASVFFSSRTLIEFWLEKLTTMIFKTETRAKPFFSTENRQKKRKDYIF